jgi:SAM-dependent methyltransferase
VNDGACPACGGPLRAWLEAPAGEPRDPRRFALARCGRCGSAVTRGEPPGPEAYETGAYAPSAPRAARALAPLQHALAGRPAALLLRDGLAPGARVLDAGAGSGRVLAALQRRGFAAEGIEPSERSWRRAKAAGLPVARAAIGEHEESGLGAVVLWHVLEHLPDPAAALERVAGWLAPDGRLLVGVPNLASWQARLAGPAWLHLDLPRHRTHLTAAGLEAMLERAGLLPSLSTQAVPEHNPGAMWMAILTRLGQTPNYPWHLVKRDAGPDARDLAITALGLPLVPVAVAAEAVAGALGHGGTVAVVARKA